MLVLVGVGVVVVDDVATHRDLGDARAERDLAAQAARATEQAARRTRAADEAQALADLDTAMAREIARQRGEGVRRPILALAAGVPACTAADLQLLSPELGFLRFGNRGRPCGLLDQPGIEGRDSMGAWVPVPVQYIDSLSYTDGPVWTGTFTNITAAVLGIYPEVVDPELGGCRTGPTTPVRYSALRLVLAGAPQRFDLPGVTLDVGPCRPSVRLWAYDVTGEG
ncbi:MAG: hypothetical protein JWN67_4804 [Actinomycetia bacterium]|nr:hypothetical protein [Actinomycetes bacterium]